MISGTKLFALSVVGLVAFTTIFNIVLRMILNPDRIGAKSYDNLVQTIVLIVTTFVLSGSLQAYCMKIDGLVWNAERVSTFSALLVGCWAAGVTAYRLGFKTTKEWGS